MTQRSSPQSGGGNKKKTPTNNITPHDSVNAKLIRVAQRRLWGEIHDCMTGTPRKNYDGNNRAFL